MSLRDSEFSATFCVNNPDTVEIGRMISQKEETGAKYFHEIFNKYGTIHGMANSASRIFKEVRKDFFEGLRISLSMIFVVSEFILFIYLIVVIFVYASPTFERERVTLKLEGVGAFLAFSLFSNVQSYSHTSSLCSP